MECAGVTLTDALVEDLWRARVDATTVSSGWLERDPLSLARAAAVAEALYAHMIDAGSRQVGWKLGATDARTRAVLGSDRSFVAPLFDSGCLPVRSTLNLGHLVAPRLEMEIALVGSGPDQRAAPCIEVIDCHFAGWEIRLPEAVADFGLHSCFMLGKCAKFETAATVTAELLCDGVVVAHGNGSAHRARAIACSCDIPEDYVGGITATGTLIPPQALVPGIWTADFGALGELTIAVEA